MINEGVNSPWKIILLSVLVTSPVVIEHLVSIYLKLIELGC